MRVLHVGSGFRPMRRGGLVAYVEDLMSEQSRRGHQVAYFFSGREYPFVSGPRLKRWRRQDVSMLEVVNSPLFDHGRQPDLEVSEPRIEQMFSRVILELRPDVVHVHELAGLPTSVLEVGTDRRAPVIMTLHDYFPLCSTFRLLDWERRVCLRHEVGDDCVATTAADERGAGLMFDATVRYHLLNHPLMRRLDSPRVEGAVARFGAALGHRAASRARASDERPSAAVFQRRRQVNVERLNTIDRLVAVSRRVREIYALLGIDAGRITTTQLTLAHIERLRVRRPNGSGAVTFATLGAAESVAKGSQVLLGAARALGDLAGAGRFRLLVFGFVESAASGFAATPGVELRGPYSPDRLDELLDEVDVGIIPSIWEEAYGFAGVEFLAKGIPVIGNAIGGILEYTREGETGWLNRSRSADELASIMRKLIENPELIGDISSKVRSARDSIITSIAAHADEMDDLYRQVIAARRGIEIEAMASPPS